MREEITSNIEDVYQTWWGGGINGAHLYLQCKYGDAFSQAVFVHQRWATEQEAKTVCPFYCVRQHGITILRFKVFYYPEEGWDKWLNWSAETTA